MSSKNSSTSGVSLEEFLNIIRKKKEVQLYHNEIRHIFTAFDIHYRGFLTLEDFQRAFRLVAPKLPERTVLEVFRDTSGLLWSVFVKCRLCVVLDLLEEKLEVPSNGLLIDLLSNLLTEIVVYTNLVKSI
uniref:EF-hand calcium-binding domain-containing protein 11 isoform X1 n=1 Tax=Ictidomys tridecemlineatus TaxID=43179 RepID=UPI001A9E054B|nr:EF-hand calcium-binding domain-containing protein 11 isoform X1 [Ictidomys tridecemlineatus]